MPTEQANNVPGPPGEPLRVGLISDDQQATEFVAAIGGCPELELCAQGGMARESAAPQVEWFDDTRVLIAQGEIDALILATSPRAEVDLGQVAAERGVHVWRMPPLARSFAEAVEVGRAVRNYDVVYRVASWWEHVREVARPLLVRDGFRPIFSEVHVSTPGPSFQSWRSVMIDAGGGVLSYDAYPMIEALAAFRGLPETVFGVTGKCRRRAGEAPRETEDVAAAILNYEAGSTLIRATWDLPPRRRALLHHGADATIRMEDDQIVIEDAAGACVEHQVLPGDLLRSEFTRLAECIRSRPGPDKSAADLERHLMVSAILEVTYLSTRTGQPENPSRLFEVQKWPVPRR